MTKRMHVGTIGLYAALMSLACGSDGADMYGFDPVEPGAGEVVLDTRWYSIATMTGGTESNLGVLTVSADQPFIVEQIGISTSGASACGLFAAEPTDDGLLCEGSAAADDGVAQLPFGESCLGVQGPLELRLRCAIPKGPFANQLVVEPHIHAETTVIRDLDGNRLALMITRYGKLP